MTVSRYTSFNRAEWARLRDATPLTLSEADLTELRGLNEQLSMREVEEVYLPLSRLLNLHVAATRELERVTDRFLGKTVAPNPYILGVAGSVAVGKSTTARVLRALLARWPDHPRVDLVTTDGFLYPNRVLEERGLMARKGFPESYDRRRLVRFVADLKAGVAEVTAPVYSHLVYDILPGEMQVVRQPDILIRKASPSWTGPTSVRWTIPSSCRITSIFRSTWTPPRPTSRNGSSSGSAGCGRRHSGTRNRILESTPSSPRRRPRPSRAGSGTRSTG
jgi:hypothetical protein